MSERKRINFLYDRYLQPLNEVCGLWPAPSGSDLFEILLAADPLPNKSALEKLIRWTLEKQLDMQSLAETAAAIEVFESIKSRLPPDERDLNRYKSRNNFIRTVFGNGVARLEALLAKDATRPEKLWPRLDGFPSKAPLREQAGFALSVLLSHDPGRGKYIHSMLRWMENTAEPLLPEDLARVQDDLLLFRKNRHKISRQNRDLSACPSSTALANIVGQYRENTVFTVEELIAMEDREIKAGRAVLAGEGQDWRLLQITSKDGAIALGQGTKWCTAFTNGRQNYFKNYKDNLLYLRDNLGNRYQIHFGKEVANLLSMQFKDIDDQTAKDWHQIIECHSGLRQAISRFLPVAGDKLLKQLDSIFYGYDGFYAFISLYGSNENIVSYTRNETYRQQILREVNDLLSPKNSGSVGKNCRTILKIFQAAGQGLEPEWERAINRKASRFIPLYLKTITQPDYGSWILESFIQAAKGHPIWHPFVAKALPHCQPSRTLDL